MFGISPKSLDAQRKNDRRFFAYRQLTLEPFKDKEKAAILQYIGTHDTDPELDVANILKTGLGMTFTGYVNQLRLTEAARLLTDKAGMPIADIAFSVGYANVSYFNKLFKEEYGCTPKAFRSHGNR